MLVLTDPMGEYYAPFGTVLGEFPGLPWRGGLFYDPVPYALIGAFVECGTLPVTSLIGRYRYRGEPVMHKLSLEKPRMRPYDSSEDSRIWGTKLNQLPLLQRTLSEGAFPSFNPGNQHRTSHLSFKGEIGPSVLYPPLHVHNGDYQSVRYWGMPQYHPSYQWQGYSNHYAYDKVYVDESYVPHAQKSETGRVGIPRASLLERRAFLAENLGSGYKRWDWHVFPNSYYVTEVKDFIDHTGPFDLGCRLTYRFTFDSISDGHNWSHWPFALAYSETHSVEIVVKPRYSPQLAVDEHLSSSTSYDILDMGGVDVQITDTFDSGFCDPGWYCYGEHPDWGNPVGSVTQYQFHYSGTALIAQPQGIGGTDSLTSFSFTPLIRRVNPGGFRDNVNRVSGDLLATAYIASAEALGSGEVISSNLLETAADLREFEAVAPNFADGIKACRSLAGGQYLKSAQEFLSFIAGLRLYKSFALDPNIELVADIIPKFQKAADLVSRRRTRRYYGRYRFDFPEGEFGRETSWIVTRSLLQLPAGTNELSGILNLASLGVSPLPDSWWDLIPLSFVVDWFTGLGDRIRSATYSLLGGTLSGLVVTHSFTVMSPLTLDELGTIQAKPKIARYGSVAPVLSVMYRDVSRYFPMPRESRYDFHQPTRFPPWDLALSLAYILAS